MARKLIAGIALALCVLTATVLAQGGPFGAQIENFWRLISTGGRSFTSISVTGGTLTGATWSSASEGVTRTATSATITLTAASTPLQSVVPGANLNLNLPTAATNMHFSIHDGAAFTITIKDASAATVTSLVNGQTVNVVYDGTSWVVW